ncbi:MAG: hypothetical protein AAFN07_09345 [Pseudomonadota bacterium]
MPVKPGSSTLQNPDRPLVDHSDEGARIHLSCPRTMPHASGFLWNDQLLARFTCRGYAQVQFMQPEPTSYSKGPVLEATTFLQPELGHYAHHPGRFVYVRDDRSRECFSIPYEPVRKPAEHFEFTVTDQSIEWHVEHNGLTIDWSVRLADDDALELWTLTVCNTSPVVRELSIYPVFSIGYLSWLSQDATYSAEHRAIVARAVPPYQKLADYPSVRDQKAWTFLAADTEPQAYETVQALFEGEGGLMDPDALKADRLAGHDATYETPIAAMQFQRELEPQQRATITFAFGATESYSGLEALRRKHLDSSSRLIRPSSVRRSAVSRQKTPTDRLDRFVNHWLPRQVSYHGELQRLTTDPQTRNFLQDALGQLFIEPSRTEHAIRTTLSQQNPDGSLPDGVLLSPDATLKYINQVPHTDHSVWLPLTVEAYVRETNNTAFLDEVIQTQYGRQTVMERVDAALDWLLCNLDARHLSLIAQGDWCDPMNMVGHKGRGVSGWLSMATVYAINLWRNLCGLLGHVERSEVLAAHARRVSAAINEHLWAENRYARGITDGGRRFGTSADSEGQVFLNTQSWALLADVADTNQTEQLVETVERDLQTAFGPMMLAPPYTRMVEDIGRLTQKHPGYAENGSVYNHAAMFYIYALYQIRRSGLAFATLMKAIPGIDEEDLIRRGQLPTFIPNYYRGAVDLHPRTAGRSSQLINTGAASWCYRIVIECLFGLRGAHEGLVVDPQLPPHWDTATVTRAFRGAVFDFEFIRHSAGLAIEVDGTEMLSNTIQTVESGHRYAVTVWLPEGP